MLNTDISKFKRESRFEISLMKSKQNHCVNREMIRLYDITFFNDFFLPAHPARPLRCFFCKFQLDFLLFLEGRGDLQWIPGCVTLAVFQVVGLLTFHAKIFIVSQFYYLYEYDISPIFALP